MSAKKLLSLGRKKGYLTYSEADKILENSAEDLDDVFDRLEEAGIGLVDSKLQESSFQEYSEKEFQESASTLLKLSPGDHRWLQQHAEELRG